MRFRHDHAILALTLALMLVGLCVLYSASHELARAEFGDGLHYLKKQLLNAFVGLVAMLVVSRLDYRLWQRASRILLLVSSLGLFVVFFFGEVRGTRGWVPLLGRTVQPVEFVRLALVFFLSAELVRRGTSLASLRRGFLPLGCVIGALLLVVVVQNDFGSAMALCLISVSLLYAGGTRKLHLVSVALLLIAAATVFAWQRPHVRERIAGFLHPEEHAMDVAYQSTQSVLSIGSGGPFGKGLGRGISKFGYIPDPHTDFVFAVMGEELGFAGCVSVLLLFLLLVARAIRIARAHEDPFAQLLAMGIGLSLFWYMAINLMVALRLFPVTGLPLPFMSYGGSSLVTHLIALGVLRSIAREVEQTPRLAGRWLERRGTLLESGL
jgi:cell division protein FtsW